LTFVVDASAALQGVLEQRDHERFRAWIRDARLAGEDLLAPTLLPFEVGNVLRRVFPTAAAAAHHDDLLLGIRHVDPAPADTYAMCRNGLTYYDAAYLALAHAAAATLVSGDRLLLAEAVAHGVPVLAF
jgi:predicted nucleic acid-binding protein